MDITPITPDLSSGRIKRAHQFGIAPKDTLQKSFEMNQSFPKVRDSGESAGDLACTAKDHSRTSDNLKLKDEFLSDFNDSTYSEVSFTSGQLPNNSNISKAHTLAEYMRDISICGKLPESVKGNFNKAIMTVNRNTTEIIMANRSAVDLFYGYVKNGKLIGSYLDDVLNMNTRNLEKSMRPCEEQYVHEEDGQIQEVTGLIMQLMNNEFSTLVSVYVKSLPEEKGEPLKSIVILESVASMAAEIMFDSTGTIQHAQDMHNHYPLLGTYSQSLIGMHVNQLIPDFEFPVHILTDDQMKIEHNITFINEFLANLPANLRIFHFEASTNDEGTETFKYYARVLSIININGLITFNEDGKIHSINDGFATNAMGYKAKDLIGHDISLIIPSIHSLMNKINDVDANDSDKTQENDDGIFLDIRNNSNNQKSPYSENGSVESGMGKSSISISLMQPTKEDVKPPGVDVPASSGTNDEVCVVSPGEGQNHVANSDVTSQPDISDRSQLATPNKLDSAMDRLTLTSVVNAEQFEEQEASIKPVKRNQSRISIDSSKHGSPFLGKYLASPSHVTSTPKSGKPHISNTQKNISDLHEFPRSYRPMECLSPMSNGIFDTSMQKKTNNGCSTLIHKNGTLIDLSYSYLYDMNLKNGSKLNCLCLSIKNEPMEPFGSNNENSDLAQLEQSLRTGNDLQLSVNNAKEANISIVDDMSSPKQCPYANEFYNLQSIGKGAFGFVRIAKRISDDKMVIVKFVKKKYVAYENYVSDEVADRMVPMEAYLLMKLDHANIIKMIDIYESDDLHILIMEKHGSSFDLFELIERSKSLGEELLAYIFKQVSSAVEYLHHRRILHRDIKDENIIINDQFQVKLIDFGSATFMPKDGELFSTFCGTYEYCSPEVLNGHKYRGPELEMWTMGITLYTLVFSENPFVDMEDTLKCNINPPFKVSRELERLIYALLEYSEYDRMTLPELLKSPWFQQPINIEDYKWESIISGSDFNGNISM